jgi:rhamnogalacturonan endolyase
MSVKDTDNAADWKIVTASQGGLVFGDRDYTYTKFPAQLNGAESLLTACDSKNATGDLAEFTAGAKTDVYVFLDTRVETENNVPSWLGSWTKTDMTAETSNDVVFSVYKKTINQGEKVVLGNNNMTGNVVNYTVFAAAANEQATTQPTTAPTTQPTTQPTQPPQTNVRYGDANCDGKVTIADAAAIFQYLSNPDKYTITAEGKKNSDVYNVGDGITTSDAIAIQKLDAGIISSLPQNN